MQRAHGRSLAAEAGASAHEAAAAAARAEADAAVATVAPLLQLKRAAHNADRLARYARALELYERALAAAEVALPRDSLVIAALLDELHMTHHDKNVQAFEDHTCDLNAIAAETVALVRSFHRLHARWQAGTLFSPTAEEVAYFVEDEFPRVPAQLCGAFLYLHVAQVWVQQPHDFPPCPTLAEAEARLHAIHGALHAALETDARGMLERDPRTGQAWPASSSAASPADGFPHENGGARPCDGNAVRRGRPAAPPACHVRSDGCARDGAVPTGRALHGAVRA